MRRIAALLAAAASLVFIAPAAYAAPAPSGATVVRATFDSRGPIVGRVRFVQTGGAGGPIVANGSVSGLPKNTQIVTVPYVLGDSRCTPVPGVIAFPSAIIKSDAQGRARFSGVTINQQAINPAGSADLKTTASVSFRIVLVASPLPPVPTVPNVVSTIDCTSSLNVFVKR